MVFDDIELRYFPNQVAHSDLLIIIHDTCALMPLNVTTVKGFTFSPEVSLFFSPSVNFRFLDCSEDAKCASNNILGSCFRQYFNVVINDNN